MKRYSLDKLLDADGEYTAEHNKAYVIKRIGTDDTEEVTVSVDDKGLSHITQLGMPLHKINTALLPPLDLGDLFLVVPPEYKLSFNGTAAKLVRIQGDVYVLDSGEVLPSDLLARFKAQLWHYRNLIIGSAVTTGASWAIDGEVELDDFSPSTVEKFLLNNLMLVEETVAGDAAETEGDVAIRLYLDDVPLDIKEATMGYLGISRYFMPAPPAETTEICPFSLKDAPIEVLPDHVLKVKAMNVSGGVLFATTAAQYTLYTVVDYQKFGV